MKQQEEPHQEELQERGDGVDGIAYMRMTTDAPEDNLHTLLNYAYAKDMEVYLRYAGGRQDVPLALYIETEAHAQGCKDVTRQGVIDGDDCFECDGCVLAILNAVATQAAELRERLKQFEDIGYSPKELERLAALGAQLTQEAKERAETRKQVEV